MSLGTFQLYETHDNGGRLFRVFVDKTAHIAYITSIDSEDFNVNVRIAFRRVFIGKSNKGALYNGPDYDGNSILFEIDHNEYLFVGDHICRFHASHPIRKFSSPVEGNDVPYPFAVDTKGDYYLLTSSARVKIPGSRVVGDDAYNPFFMWGENKSIGEKMKLKVLIPTWAEFRKK